MANKQESVSTAASRTDQKLEELPRLLTIEPWIAGRRVLYIGSPSGQSLKWLESLGARSVSLLGDCDSPPANVETWAEEGGLSAIPTGSQDLIIVDDLAVELAEDEDLIKGLERILADAGILVGVLPAEGDHVGMSMMAHARGDKRLSYEAVIELLENRFPDVDVASQVPVLGYAVVPSSAGSQLQFDARLHSTSEEPPLYYLISASKALPPDPEARLVTLSYDQLSDRVGRVVGDLTEQLQALEDRNNGRRREQQVLVQELTQRLGEVESRETSHLGDLAEATDANRRLEAVLQNKDTELATLRQGMDERVVALRDRLADLEAAHDEQESVDEERRDLERELALTRKKLDDWAGHSAQLRVETEKRAAECHRLESRSRRLGRELRRARLDHSEAQRRRGQLEKLLADAKSLIEQQADSKRETEADSDLASHLQKQLRHALAQEEDLNEQISQVEMALEQSRSQLEKETQLRRQVESTAQGLAAQLQRQTTELDGLIEDRQNLQTERDRLKSVLAASETEIQELTTERNTLRDQAEDQKSRRLEMVQELTERRGRQDQLKQELERREAMLAQRDGEIEAVNLRLDSARETAATVQQSLSELRAAGQELSPDEDSTEELSVALQALARQGDELARLEAECRLLQSQISKQSDPVAGHQRILDQEHQARVANLIEERTQQEAEITRLRAEAEQAALVRQDLLVARRDLEALEQEHRVLMEQAAKLTQPAHSLEDMLAQHRVLLQEVDALRTDRQQAEADRDEAHKQQQTLQEAMAAQQDDASQAESRAVQSQQALENQLAEARARAEADALRAQVEMDEREEAHRQELSSAAASAQNELAQQIERQAQEVETLDQRYRKEIKALRLVFDHELEEALNAAEGREAKALEEIKATRTAILAQDDREEGTALALVQQDLIKAASERDRAMAELETVRKQLKDQNRVAAEVATDEEILVQERQARELAQSALARLEAENAQLLSERREVDTREQEMLQTMEARAHQQNEQRALALAKRAARLVGLIERLEQAAPQL